LIAQLLRLEDCDSIREKIATQGVPRWVDVVREEETALWCSRLIEQGDPALQEFMEVHPESDRGQLRTLVRAAQQDASGKKVDRARRKLSELVGSLRGRSG